MNPPPIPPLIISKQLGPAPPAKRKMSTFKLVSLIVLALLSIPAAGIALMVVIAVFPQKESKPYTASAGVRERQRKQDAASEMAQKREEERAAAERQKNLAIRKAREAKDLEDFGSVLIEHFKTHPYLTDQDKVAMRDHKVTMGMHEDDVLYMWGMPQRKNNTVFTSGTHSQWIYGGTYLYFENGVLTSWQTSEGK